MSEESHSHGSRSRKLTRGDVRSCLVLTCLALSAWSGCAGTREPPILLPLLEAEQRVPIVIVPGITGSELRDRETGELVWGRAKNLFLPRDGGHNLALPLEPAPDWEPSLEVGEAIREIRLAWTKKPVYGPIADLLEANGYQRGDLSNPSPEADLFFFPYDWRRDNVETAGLLAERLEALRLARGEERLEVSLICQSNGGHLCRYLAKYGGATLEEVEAGRAGPPERLRIDRMLFIGTANGGSIRILREVDRGRTYAPVVGRRLLPEVLFSFPSIFQDLPAYLPELFLGEEGELLQLDLYDPETWLTYGWSVFSDKARKRLAGGPEELFGDEQTRWRFLARSLDRAKRFQAVLKAEVAAYEPGRYYLLQNVYRQTPERGVLMRKDGDWEVLFSGDKELRDKPYLLSMASGPGDGHAVLASQLWLSEKEKAALAKEAFNIEDGHFEMILNRGTHQRILDFLMDD